MGKMITVEEGDTLLAIAHAHGVLDWQSIWLHQGNVDLRRKRQNPQALREGDRVYVPGRAELPPFLAEVQTGFCHTFVLRPNTPCVLSVHLLDEDGEPYADKRYELTVEGTKFEGRTGTDGLVEHEVPPGARTGELVLHRTDEEGDSRTWTLDIGGLDPVETVSGVKGRLRNLSYYHGPIDDELSDEALAAFLQFLEDNRVDVPEGDDVFTPETRRALVEACGG